MKAWLLALAALGAAAAAASSAAVGVASEVGPPGIVLHGPEQATHRERARIEGVLRRFDIETRQHEVARMLEHELGRQPTPQRTRGNLIREREMLDQRFYLERQILEHELGQIPNSLLRSQSAAELRRIDIERRMRMVLKEQELRSRRALEGRPPAHRIGLQPHRPGLGPHRPGLRR
jgi:hypothetical protein